MLTSQLKVIRVNKENEVQVDGRNNLAINRSKNVSVVVHQNTAIDELSKLLSTGDLQEQPRCLVNCRDL